MTKRRSPNSNSSEPDRGARSSRIALWCAIAFALLVVGVAGICYMHWLFPEERPPFELPTPTQPPSLLLGG